MRRLIVAALALTLFSAGAKGDAAGDCNQSDDMDRRIDGCTQLIDRNPTGWGAYFNRGTAYRAMGEYERSIADYTKSIEINPDFLHSYTNRALTYEKMGDKTKAIADYTKALEIDPATQSAKKGLERLGAAATGGEKDSDCLAKNGDLAIRACTRIIESQLVNGKKANEAAMVIAYKNRSFAYLYKEEYKKAVSDANEMIKRDPKSAYAYFLRGIANYNGDRPDEGIADLKKAVELDPSNKEARGALEELGIAVNQGVASKSQKAIGKTEESSAVVEVAPPAASVGPPRTLSGHSQVVEAVTFSPDGLTALTGSWDGSVKLWDLATGKELRTFKGRYDVYSVAFSPDGRTMLMGTSEKASGSWRGIIKLWDVATGEEIKTFRGHTGDAWAGTVYSVAFSPDGRTALSGSDDDTLKLWDVATGKEVRTFKGHAKDVRSVAFSPDGATALSGSKDTTMRLWDVATGKEIRAFPGHERAVESVAFSADGRTALSGSLDKTLKLWDVATGKEIRTFPVGLDVRSAAFSPDGRTVLVGNGDQTDGKWTYTLLLLDVETGGVIGAFNGHSGEIRSVAFAPNGRNVLSGSWDETARLWDLQRGD